MQAIWPNAGISEYLQVLVLRSSKDSENLEVRTISRKLFTRVPQRLHARLHRKVDEDIVRSAWRHAGVLDL